MDPFINPRNLQDASTARLLIAITFHFVPGRIGYLEKVLQSLAAFPVAQRDIVVFTNTTDPVQQGDIRRVFEATGLIDGRDARCDVVQGLAHPYNLTWAHKKLIPESFLASGSPYSHFIYLEDDEQLTFEGFAYFLAARKILLDFGLIPAFLRVEWNANEKYYVNTDNIAPVDLANRPFISNGACAFIEPDNPYSGSFILDQDLAREYVASRSFHLERSCEMSSWNVRERAAMGLTFENPPAPFIYRTVVPVSVASRTAPECAWLAHLPNNHISNLKTRFGKIPMTKLFTGDFDMSETAQSLPREHPPYKLYAMKRWSAKNMLRSLLAGKLKIKIVLKRLFPSNR